MKRISLVIKLKALTLASLCACALLQSQAFAGLVSSGSVFVGTNEADGALSRARTDAGSREDIGCEVDPSPASFLMCYATDASGKSYSCYAAGPPDSWIRLIERLNTTSFVEFAGDSTGRCTTLLVYQNSMFM